MPTESTRGSRSNETSHCGKHLLRSFNVYVSLTTTIHTTTTTTLSNPPRAHTYRTILGNCHNNFFFTFFFFFPPKDASRAANNKTPHNRSHCIRRAWQIFNTPLLYVYTGLLRIIRIYYTLVDKLCARVNIVCMYN